MPRDPSGASGEQVKSRNNMEMIGSANDFAAERIYKAPAVNAFVGSSNRNCGRFGLLRPPPSRRVARGSASFFSLLLTLLVREVTRAVNTDWRILKPSPGNLSKSFHVLYFVGKVIFEYNTCVYRNCLLVRLK